MEFYLSFNELLGKSGNPILLVFVPVFFITTVPPVSDKLPPK